MNTKKKRAAFAGGLLYIQAAQMVIMLGIMLTKEISLKDGFLPEAERQVGFLVMMIVVTLLYYLLMGKKEGRGTAGFIAIGGLALGIFLVDLFFFTKSVKMTSRDTFYACLGLIALLGLVVIHILFNEKHYRFPMIFAVGFTAVIAASGLLQYRNEVLNQKAMIPMFIGMAVMLVVYLYMDDKYSKYVGIVLAAAQAIASAVAYVKLKKSKNIMKALDGFTKKVTEKQILKYILMALAVMLVITIILQFIKNYEIVGKLLSITCICIIILAYNVIGGLETEARDSFGINVMDATQNATYGVYVRLNDSAKSLDDIKGYKIAIHKEHDAEEMDAAVAKLQEQAGTALNIITYANLSELGTAFYQNEVNAVFIECSTANYIDADFEAREIEWMFSENTKIVANISVPIKKNDDEIEPQTDPGLVDPDDQGIIIDPVVGEQKDDLTKSAFVVYVSGIDVYGDIKTKSRSDVNVLMAVNPVTKEIALVTTPRDAYLEIPGKTKEGKRDKLTHAGSYGVNYSIATLENLYGINVDFYVRINFSGVQNVVNLLGGVDVVSLYNFTARHGNYPFKKGVNHMNGSQAVSFARERITLPGGDVTRGKHHIELIKGIFAKVTTTAVLTNYQSLLDSVSNNFQTDVETDQIAALAAMQLSDSAEWHFTSYATSGEGATKMCASYSGGELWVSILNKDSVSTATELLSKVLNGEHIADGEYQY